MYDSNKLKYALKKTTTNQLLEDHRHGILSVILNKNGRNKNNMILYILRETILYFRLLQRGKPLR